MSSHKLNFEAFVGGRYNEVKRVDKNVKCVKLIHKNKLKL